MKIRYTATGIEEHVANNIGQFAIKTGLAVEVPSGFPKPIPEIRWAVRQGRATVDYEFPPYIVYTCGQQTMCVENVSRDFAVRNCGVLEKIPPHIWNEYEALATAYAKRSKKPPKERVSRFIQDPRILAAQGVKSTAVLQEELRLQMHEAALRK